MFSITGEYLDGDDPHFLCDRFYNKKKTCRCGSPGDCDDYKDYCFCFCDR